MEQRHIDSARKILKTIKYFNIATVNADGSPWNTIMSGTDHEQFNFHWGSHPDSVHSQNIRRDGRVFITIYDTSAPEGTGEGLYVLGKAEEVGPEQGGALYLYKFTPERVWINDVVKNEDGSYKHDIRVELSLPSIL